MILSLSSIVQFNHLVELLFQVEYNFNIYLKFILGRRDFQYNDWQLADPPPPPPEPDDLGNDRRMFWGSGYGGYGGGYGGGWGRPYGGYGGGYGMYG